jgi:PAS domain-containing protein
MRRLATTARFLALMMGDERMPLSSQDDADRLDGVSGVGASEKQLSIEDQLRATVNVIPGHVWYATPSGALIFVNSRSADYLGLPKDHPLRFGIDLGGEWDSHISLLHPDDHEETRKAWSSTASQHRIKHASAVSADSTPLAN